MLMIHLFLILRILQQCRINLKNSYKQQSKTLIKYNFVVPRLREVLYYYEEKLTSKTLSNILYFFASAPFFSLPKSSFP